MFGKIIPSKRVILFNGVAIRSDRYFLGNDTYPNAKEALIAPIKDRISPTDRVVHIGGGRGIAPVKTAEWAFNGETIVYEAAAEVVESLFKTAELNQVNLDIRHSIVGEAGEVYGDTSKANQTAPEDLHGDILVLDCEGAEMDILPVDGFDTVICETHPKFGAPTQDVIDLMGGKIVAEDSQDGHIVVSKP